MIIYLNEDEIKEIHKRCKVERAWKQMSDAKKKEILISSLMYIDINEYIETNILKLIDIPELDHMIFENFITFDPSIEKKEKIIKRLFKHFKPEYIIKIIFLIEGIRDEYDYINQYLDELYDEYLIIDHIEEHWCDGIGYDIIHINDVSKIIKEYAHMNNQQKHLDDYLQSHNVTDIEQLSKEEKEHLLSSLCPIMY